MFDPSLPDSQLDANNFDSLRAFLKKSCGISLGDNKQYLVVTRLRRIMGEQGFDSFSQLTGALLCGARAGLKEQVIEAMTTNETFWFRDRHPFDSLRQQVLPELHARSHGRVKIWCAACSSGQEPYSIAMTAKECRTPSGAEPSVDILATDLSGKMLEKARAGIYADFEINRGLERHHIQKYFKAMGRDWQIDPSLSKSIRFRSFNLLDSYEPLGRFDIIFCRNVLIYFSQELKQDILRRMHKQLVPGGYLFLGSSEGPNGLESLFQMQQFHPGIAYRAKPL